MRALLMAMPDIAPRLFSRRLYMPSLALVSLAGNCPGHEVWAADLNSRRPRIKAAVLDLVRRYRPQVVGLSAMSFQFDTAWHVARLLKELDGSVRTVLGGYHATLLAEDLARSDAGAVFDCFVRGEGERVFPALLDALQQRRGLPEVQGLSWRDERGRWRHNPRSAILDLAEVRLPDRSRRVYTHFGFRGYGLEVVETSRGCFMRCKFCSMHHMYGHTFRTYPIERVIADLEDVRARGGRMVLFADDNITLDAARLAALCEAIRKAGLDRIRYLVQASSLGLARNPDLAPAMARAGVDMVFLGIENVSRPNLRAMGKGDIVEDTRRAVRLLHDAEIIVVGGMIVGLEHDTAEDVAANFGFFRELRIDWLGDQILQPYPKTALREEWLQKGLVTNPDDYRRYDGYWANVRTRHLTSDELQFHRWRAKTRYEFLQRPKALTLKKHPVIARLQNYLLYPAAYLAHRARGAFVSEYEHYRRDMEADARLNAFAGLSDGPMPIAYG